MHRNNLPLDVAALVGSELQPGERIVFIAIRDVKTVETLIKQLTHAANTHKD